MISVYPVFFQKFQCKADKCRHTCCQKWEIDIDPVSLKKYQKLPGTIGDDTRKAIAHHGDTAYFSLNKEGYCHLLKDGLCRLILEAGEDYLCDICRNHPRFYKYLGDYELSGTGLCCEKTIELLEGDQGNLLFTWSESDDVFDLHDFLTLFGIDMNRKYLRFIPLPDETSYRDILKAMKETEPLDKNWTKQLSFMEENLDHLVKNAKAYSNTYDKDYFTRIYQYILYRTLGEAETIPLETIVKFSQDAVQFIYMGTVMYGKKEERTARWSEQIEYDEENLALLLKL